jgi:hypothetical protein
MDFFLIIKYMIVNFIICYVLFITYFKLRFPFWSKQPIFYYHDLKNLFFPQGVIEASLPNFTNKIDKSIDFKKAEALTNEEITSLTTLLNNNFMTEPHEKYIPSSDFIMDHLLCKNIASNVSLYYEKVYGDLIGLMTSSSKKLYKKELELDIGYIDNLCVDKKHRGKNVAGKLIQTHYVRERYLQKLDVFFFKHEGSSRPFVPLTIYNCYFYNLNEFPKIQITQRKLNIILIGENTLSLLYDLYTFLKNNIKKSNNHFKYMILDEYEHVSYLIKKQHIFVFVLMDEKRPQSFYFFRNNHTTYNGEQSAECFASIKINKLENNSSYSHTSIEQNIENDKFKLGFYLAIDYLKTIDKYKILLLEAIADTPNLIKNIDIQPYTHSKYYYYLYNYAAKPVLSNDIVII